MSSSKKNIVIDLKNNYNEKIVLIDNLKELIHSSISNAEKIKSFNSIREKWIKIGSSYSPIFWIKQFLQTPRKNIL